jgi:ABC-type branched-subunit amino acid transport system ATPase component
MSDVILKASDVSIVFGGLRAVSDFSCELRRGELLGIIGPNGAGKTTIFNMLSGIYPPTSGNITFFDKQGVASTVGRAVDKSGKPHSLIRYKSPAELNRIGIARTFQNIRLFGNLTVLENVLIALHASRTERPLGVLLRLPCCRRDEERMRRRAEELLAFFNIADKINEKAQSLPYGQQRKLEIVRALASNPTLLLLDEPAAGMNVQETTELMRLISAIRRDFHLTILLIEHDMKLVMGICERLIVLNYGRIIAAGTPDTIKNNPAVLKAYLGGPKPRDNSKQREINPKVTNKPLLTVNNLVVRYGAIEALHDISFMVNKGEIVTLIGANGAGKTTTLHAVSALVKKTSGQAFFDGNDITNVRPERIVALHLAHVPEGRRIFANLTVRENLDMGAFTRRDTGVKADIDMAYSLFPRLKERAAQIAGTLSGGEQQMLAIARALMLHPTLLLLDEPSMGLAPILVDEIFDIIQRINNAGATILLVEQNAYKALGIADRAYVLETGTIVKSGNAEKLAQDPAVREAYLG